MVAAAVRSNLSDDPLPVMKDDYVQKAMFRILHFLVGPQTVYYTYSPECILLEHLTLSCLSFPLMCISVLTAAFTVFHCICI